MGHSPVTSEVALWLKHELILIPSLPPVSYPFGPAFGKNHYYVLIICLWVGERTARSGL